MNYLNFLTAALLATGCADIEKSGADWRLSEPSEEPVSTAQEPELVNQERDIRPDTAYDHSATTALLDGRWTEQNVGCVVQYVWNEFAPAGEFVASEEMYGAEDLEVLWSESGDWSIDEYGTVSWAYEIDGRPTTHRRTAAFVSGPLAAEVHWDQSDDVVWPSGAFAPNTTELRTFRSVFYRGSTLTNDELYETGSTVDLTLSAPPVELAQGAPCHMELRATTPDGSEAMFEGACTVSVGNDATIRVIHATEYPADWHEAAEQSRQQAQATQASQGEVDYATAETLRVATIPVLLFDSDNPAALVRPGGYSVLGTQTP